MAAKTVKSSDANRDLLPKQIRCMNGIFQLFDRRLFFVGRSFGSHHHKRLLVGGQQKLEPHNATKADIEKDPDLQKGRTRESSESFLAASSLSSSLSSTHSKWKQPLKRGLHSPDLRDVVDGSMYREARGVTIKSSANNEKVAVMKHVDSPRPLQRSKGTKDERVALPRFSYDGRETRDTVKTKMKLKELPRFSLDSKASSLKHSALDSRLNSLCCDLHMENDNFCEVKKESGSHSRSSSIVTKLMGLDDFPDSISKDESADFLLKTATTAERSSLKQDSSSRSVWRKNPASQSPQQRKTTSVTKTTACSKLPLSSQQSQKISRKSGKAKAPADSSYPSSSVYGQIEKRITELEFKRSGKDLRALKQILEAMQKTREKLENQRRDSDELKLQEHTLEESCSDQNSYQQLVLTIKETCRPKQLSSSTGVTKLTKVMGKVKISSFRPQDSKYEREDPAHRERANYRTPMNSNKKDINQQVSYIEKKITWRNLESEHSAPQRISVENCTTSGRGSGLLSPRTQHIVLKPERESHPNALTSESDRARRQLSKKLREKNGKHRVKSTDLQLSNKQLSNLSSETRYSSYHGDTSSTKSESNIESHAETNAKSPVNFFSLNSRRYQDYVKTPKQEMPVVELAAIMMEQPSPVSVLDNPFYSEGSPSPVKKISTTFQDESPGPDEAEWNLNHLAACTKSDSSYKNNQKSENMLDLIYEPGFLRTKRYDTSIIQMDSHLVSMGNIFNSNTFHTLPEVNDLMDANKELIRNTDQIKPSQKLQRKIVADVANELLVRKITSGRLFKMGRRRMSLHGLIREVYLEMEHLYRMPHCNVDDGDDSSTRALNVDMKYQSDDWNGHSGEVPALVLGIERLIFKDLINEVITCEISDLYL